MLPTKKEIKEKDELYRKSIKRLQGKKGTEHSVKAMEIYNADFRKGRGTI